MLKNRLKSLIARGMLHKATIVITGVFIGSTSKFGWSEQHDFHISLHMWSKYLALSQKVTSKPVLGDCPKPVLATSG